MKKYASFYLLLVISVLPARAFGQRNSNAGHSANPATILWKITGKDCKKPSYLLGTMHLADSDWLLEYPEMKKVIDSTTFILTEAFTTEPAAEENSDSQLKALPLLTKAQFHMLDSFFVARLGEGITANPDAEIMTVPEMGSAIMVTLTTQSRGANGVSKFVDLDLFTLYQKLGRKGDRLDRVPPTIFFAKDSVNAKRHLSRSLNLIDNSDKPGWNLYQQEDIDDVIADYKEMKIDYKLSENATKIQESDDFDFVPIEKRNHNWMKKITENIATQPCLIAVGLAHLYYQTGVISLLRKRGYSVEPVILTKRR